MAKQQHFRVKLKRNFSPIDLGEQVQTVSGIAVRRMAESLRDKMKDAYEKSLADSDSEYRANGNYTPSTSLSHFIVVSPKHSPIGVYTVGAKDNQIVGRQYVSEIFKYMDEGTGSKNGDPWVFPLQGARANNSENGYWVTRGQDGKGFISDVANRYAFGEFDVDVSTGVKTMIETTLQAHGYSVKSYLKK